MIVTIHRQLVTRIPRYSVSHDHQRTWLLHIRGAQPEDAGRYMCQVNSDPMVSQVGNLHVVGQFQSFTISDDVSLVAVITDALLPQYHHQLSTLKVRRHSYQSEKTPTFRSSVVPTACPLPKSVGSEKTDDESRTKNQPLIWPTRNKVVVNLTFLLKFTK